MTRLLLALLCVLSAANIVPVEARYLRALTTANRVLQSLVDQANATTFTNSEVNASISVSQSSFPGLVDLVHLIPFDVQIAVTANNGIQTQDVASIVTAWLRDAYIQQLASYGYTEANKFARFNTVVLFNNDAGGSRRRRWLQGGAGQLFTAKFKGGAVFTRDPNRTTAVPQNDVLLIEQVTMLNDTALSQLLQSSTLPGLGSAVVAVNAFLNPTAAQSTTTPNATTGSTQSKSLGIVIVVAIAVACVAFVFLLGAVIWAYRYDRSHQHRQAYLATEHAGKDISNNPERTDSDTAFENDSPERIRAVHVERSDHAYPAVIGGDDGDHDYPESVISDSMVSGSVISEDISTSLSQYYRSGMGKVGIGSAEYGGRGMLNDAGSVSSMESYGYSLDGGLSTPMPCEPYKKDRERIGGLPIEPDNLGENYDANVMEDVQIPDLDKELANLDIQLSPDMEHEDVESSCESYSHQDLEEYQMQDLEEMEALSHRSPISLEEPKPRQKLGRMPVDVDLCDDEETLMSEGPES